MENGYSPKANIMTNLHNKQYVKFLEIVVAGTVLNLVGPKALELLIYPLANRFIPYKQYDECSDTVEWLQILRLLFVVLILFGYFVGFKKIINMCT
jgi:hypothetical protein